VDGAFRVSAGIAAGISAGRLRGPSFASPHWGIRTAAEPATALESAMAFQPRMPDRAFFFGITAARIWGLPLPRRHSDGDIHIGVRFGARRVTAAGVRAHHVTLADVDCTTRWGVQVTTVERTWCDLAASGLTLSELVAAGDFAIWHRHRLTTRRALESAMQRYVGRRGSRTMRRALELLTDRADSAPESELRVAIIEAGLANPSVNAPVNDSHGRFLAQPDLTWPSQRLALEYEGDHHRTDRSQWHRDLERYARLQEHGWIVIRATAADYRDPRRLLARLHRMLVSPDRDST
jgi:hypothetical protein